MKRLMIYSKHSNNIISGTVYALKENSNTILLFSLFLCGAKNQQNRSNFIKSPNLPISQFLFNYFYHEIIDNFE